MKSIALMGDGLHIGDLTVDDNFINMSEETVNEIDKLGKYIKKKVELGCKTLEELMNEEDETLWSYDHFTQFSFIELCSVIFNFLIGVIDGNDCN